MRTRPSAPQRYRLPINSQYDMALIGAHPLCHANAACYLPFILTPSLPRMNYNLASETETSSEDEYIDHLDVTIGLSEEDLRWSPTSP